MRNKENIDKLINELNGELKAIKLTLARDYYDYDDDEDGGNFINISPKGIAKDMNDAAFGSISIEGNNIEICMFAAGCASDIDDVMIYTDEEGCAKEMAKIFNTLAADEDILEANRNRIYKELIEYCED